MKGIGLKVLIAGFIWLMFDAVESFTSYQHTRWIWQSKHLPIGDSVPRDEAVLAMRELSLNLKNRHLIVIMPAGLMLVGGLLIFFARDSQTKNPTSQTNESSE